MKSMIEEAPSSFQHVVQLIYTYVSGDKIPMTYMKYCYLHVTWYQLSQISNHDIQQNAYSPPDAFKLLHILTTLVRKSLVVAAENGELGVLALLGKISTNQWTADVCTGAAMYGHVNCLRYAHENGCPWDKNTCVRAAMYGSLDCLKYAYHYGMRDSRCLYYAKLGGHDECVSFLEKYA